ncbi:hypothetical protein [Bradyrhizobium manausense]|uniref:hypothetical protein n=1 Tax=Bradyrhizobium manausense TaxID=989370 RepID=UPI000B0BF5E1|nr:hypothetical protein [Bradyrhizobium manausense]
MTNWQSDLDALIAETKAFVEKAGAKRLADEYDAAQDRGELRSNGERTFSSPEKVSVPS